MSEDKKSLKFPSHSRSGVELTFLVVSHFRKPKVRCLSVVAVSVLIGRRTFKLKSLKILLSLCHTPGFMSTCIG